jgi:hypothetical protein
MNMMDINMREDLLFRHLLGGGTTFDWLTVLSLFLVGLFFLLPQIQNHTLSGRARACFLGALWILVVKLFLNLVKTLLINLDLFNNIVGQRGGSSGPGLGAVVMLFFPVLEGMLFILAAVLFVAGLPGMIQRRDVWEPGMPPREREDDRQ